MRVTYKGDYALKAVLDLSLRYGEELVTTQELAKRIDAPVKFLEQVMVELKKNGIVQSKRGKIGGYILGKNPASITVGDIVRIIDGPIEPIACGREEYTNCADLKTCIFRKIWKQVDQATSEIIDGVTFEDLVKQVNQRNDVLTFSI